MPSRPRPSRVVSAALVGALVLISAQPWVSSAQPAAFSTTNPAGLVDPFIGTGGGVHDFPGADVPFGMLQWSPDTPTRPRGGGYSYGDDSTIGFSLTHLSGSGGCPAVGEVPILPTTAALSSHPDGMQVALDHTHETATPGYYSVDAGGVITQLSTTTHAGLGRFQFPKHAQPHFVLKLDDSAAGASRSSFHRVGRSEVVGSVTTGRFCGSVDQYTLRFDLVFDRPIASARTWRSAHGGPGGAYLGFRRTHSNTVLAKVGISYVDIAGAQRNRRVEVPKWDIGAVIRAAHNRWNYQLGKLRVSGGTRGEQVRFYTALYHSLLHPNVFSDVDGRYAGSDGKVHRAPRGRTEYSNFSGWDIYRTQVPLEAMLAPATTSDQMRSMLDVYQQTGQLPKWRLNDDETYVMVGDPADAIIADAWAFGARNFNAHYALGAMVHQATHSNRVRPGLKDFTYRGFIPVGGRHGCCNFYGPVSTQLEYDAADHAISSFATAIGAHRVARQFATRANNWLTSFNPATGYLQPKLAHAQFGPRFNPSSNHNFVEGNAYQYTPMVPFDVRGIVTAAGGNGPWVRRLDRLTRRVGSFDPRYVNLHDEPSLSTLWEYDYVGAPYKTQWNVRRAMNLYWIGPAGIPGNDDLGTMSAWFVWAALGFYPMMPGNARMALGSPLFPLARIDLPSGHTLSVVGAGAGGRQPYVHSMSINRTPWSHAYLPPALFSSGGTVRVALSSTPNRGFGSRPQDAPPSDGRGLPPAVGWASTSALSVHTKHRASVTLGVRSIAGGAQSVAWHVVRAHGMRVQPSSGTLHVRPGHPARRGLVLTAPRHAHRAFVRVAMTGAGGVHLPAVVVEVDVHS